MTKYEGIVDEILFYSERSDDGRWIIPIEVDWDFTLTKCSCWKDDEMIPNKEAFEIMKRWSRDYNVGWILNSLRHDEILQKPLEILKDENVALYGIRKNPNQDKDGNIVPKCFAVFSIDDRNVGIPQAWHEGCKRPHVDWTEVDKMMTPILEEVSQVLEKIKI